MKTQQYWLRWVERMLLSKDFEMRCGCRKILYGQTLVLPRIDTSVQLADIGYRHAKLQALVRGYVHELSIQTAQYLWNKRISTKKYGSVGFTCYNHLIKGKSNMGPCLQSIVLSYYIAKGDGPYTNVDIFYRTTEAFKKFPADLVLIRDVLLSRFNLEVAPLNQIRFNFANVTIHPMYWLVTAHMLDDPIYQLGKIKRIDPHMWIWIVKWSGRYLCEEYSNGILKFSQALRARDGCLENLREDMRDELAEYMRQNWPRRNGHE